MVHEGSTIYFGSVEDAVVGLDYRRKGVENVYVTGASLCLVSGSWNPTLTW
ncbi:GMC family oxidoreductase [Paenibacillus polymyxa]|uniref:GMC oxidoreductase n=1 Tax=Paenibacillus polymyxa TaxID=1406 RepID=UPI0009B8E27A|nr:GMC oxidoreductase [Paenibacillus polymyxa]MCH6188403.1 GMC family oxidoreductase [Paenibacillus polymyxa]WRL61293.1 GMC oxidoreductase [Paenibacillus polymyxa]